MGCLTGFIFQSKEVCEIYFKYKTRISTMLALETELPTPALSVCFMYPFIINRTEYKKYGIAKDSPRTASDPAWKELRNSLLTIKQIFQLTPHGHDTIHSCAKRRNGMWTYDFKERDSCIREIGVVKYFMQEFMCYMYSFVNLPTISLDRVSHAVNYLNAVFHVRVKDIPPTLVLYTFIHPSDGLPLVSRNFGKQIYRQTNPDGFSKPNKIYVTFRHNEIHRLPEPYDTACTFEDKKEGSRCLRLCLIKNMKAIHRFPATEVTFDPIDLKHICVNDLSNDTTYQVIDSIYKSCEPQCYRLWCDAHFMTTNIHSYFDPHRKNLLEFRVMIPDSPSVKISYSAMMDFIDFFVYMCSSFGMWFGLSVASLNPMKIKVRKFLTTTTNRKSRMEERVDLLMQMFSDLKRQIDLQNRRQQQRRYPEQR